MDKIRLRFKKTGRAVYISHLDLMHTMQRGFSRAGYELKYSEGFNPHPILSILLPLSVGCSSVCELMDFKLKQDCPLAALPEELTAVLPEGIEITEAYEPQRKAAELKWLAVDGVFEYDERPAYEMAGQLTEFFQKDEILVPKKTKRGMGEFDVKAAVKEISFEANGNDVKVKAVISAQEPTLNPELLAEALRLHAQTIAPDFAKFTRTETYDPEMNVYR